MGVASTMKEAPGSRVLVDVQLQRVRRGLAQLSQSAIAQSAARRLDVGQRAPMAVGEVATKCMCYCTLAQTTSLAALWASSRLRTPQPAGEGPAVQEVELVLVVVADPSKHAQLLGRMAAGRAARSTAAGALALAMSSRTFAQSPWLPRRGSWPRAALSASVLLVVDGEQRVQLQQLRLEQVGVGSVTRRRRPCSGSRTRRWSAAACARPAGCADERQRGMINDVSPNS